MKPCPDCEHPEHVGWCSAPSIASAGGCDCYTPEPDPISTCPACGDPIDYCSGHGEIGDPAGFRILQLHDDDDHTECHPRGCEYAEDYEPLYERDED